MTDTRNKITSSTRQPYASAVRRLILGGIMILVGAACTPELIPIPVTQEPTAAPISPTAPAIAAPLVPVPGIVAIHMIDEISGWAISDTAILRTADGGATWHNVGPTAVNSFGYAVSSEFLDVLHGWVLVPDPANMLNGILYRTRDGGVTWEETPVPFGAGPLEMLDTRDGWVMSSLGAGAGSMGVAIFQTQDGGASWTQTYTNDPNQAGAGDTLPLGGLKDGLTAVNMKSAWVGGVTYTPGTVYLFKTDDAGRTWKQSAVSPPPGYEQAEAETTGPIMASASVAFLPVHLSSQNGVMLAMYVSRDGGASWLASPTFIPQGGSTDFISAQTGVVWNGSNFYVTNDAAQTWTVVSPDVAFGDSFGGMDFVSAQIGFVLTGDASGARALYKSLDGGHTWSVLSH